MLLVILYISRKTECNGDVFILPAKYPNKESYRVKVQSDYQEIKMELKQDILDNKITEEEGERELTWYERRFRDNIERYGKLFEDEATKKEVSQLKAERAEKNINAIRAMGIEV